MCVVISLAGSFYLLKGNIDQDFFSMYYVGRGVAAGQNVFRDFSDNKGPLVYWFFAGLFKIFGYNYTTSVFWGLVVLDAIGIFLWLEVVSKWVEQITGSWGRSWGGEIIVACLYKSLNVGQLMGGIYAETLGMVFLALAWWSWQKEKWLVSGAFFGMAVLSRQTLVVWGMVFGWWWIKKVINQQEIIKFGMGLCGLVLAFIIHILATNSFMDVWHNLVAYNLSYASAVGSMGWNFKLDNLFKLLFSEPRLWVMILMLVPGILSIGMSGKLSREGKLRGGIIVLSGLVATFWGGVVYFHHFLQLIPVAALIISLGLKWGYRWLPWYLLVLLIAVVFGFQKTNGNDRREIGWRKITGSLEILAREKRYLMVVSYHPQLYFDVKKIAPDRNYHTFFLSRTYNPSDDYYREGHMKLKADRERMQQTLWVAIVRGSPNDIVRDYFKEYRDEFGLVEIQSFQVGEDVVSLYEAKV